MINMARVDSRSTDYRAGDDSGVRSRRSAEAPIQPIRALQISVDSVPWRWQMLEILSRSQGRSSLFLFCLICEYL